MKSYAYTVKDNRIDTTDYLPFFANMVDHGCIIETKYPEKDKRGRLHFHGVVKIHDQCYRKSLCLKGLHLKLVELKNPDRWEEYCKKDQPDSDGDTNDTDIMDRLKAPLF